MKSVSLYIYRFNIFGMNKKNISALIAVFILLAGMPLLLAQESGQSVSSGTGTIGPPVKVTQLGTSDQKSINAAEQFLKQKLGESYYSEFVSFLSGNSYEECIETNCTIKNSISFTYKPPSESRDYSLPLMVNVYVDDNNKIIDYLGPLKPYQFLVSKDDAIAKAKAYGLNDIIGASIARTVTYTSAGSTISDGYEIVWAVSSNDLAGACRVIGGGVQECIYKGVYVDVDSGEIKGEYRINPLILTVSQSGGVKLGEFFQDKNTTASNNIIYAVAVIVILVIALLLWNRFRKK